MGSFLIEQKWIGRTRARPEKIGKGRKLLSPTRWLSFGVGKAPEVKKMIEGGGWAERTTFYWLRRDMMQ